MQLDNVIFNISADKISDLYSVISILWGKSNRININILI